MAARALFVAAFAVTAPAFAGQAGGVSLGLDEVHTLTFRAPVTTVYVGNPAIADITMIDARHAFVQGKSYGRTNIVALNRDGVQVMNAGINVTGTNASGTVILNRGAERITLNCGGGRCEPAPMPGDGKNAYDPADGTAKAHDAAARQAAASDAAVNK